MLYEFLLNMHISLGQNCFPAIFLKKSKFQQNKLNGGKTMVFDVCLSTYFGIVKMFENNLSEKYFLEHIQVVSNPTSVIFKNKYPKNVLIFSRNNNMIYGDIIISDIGYIFNHESPGNRSLYQQQKWSSPDMFTKDEFKIFKDRYASRIFAMKKYIEYAVENEEEVQFHLNTFVVPIKLRTAIRKTYPTLNFKIIVYKISAEVQNVFHDFSIYKDDPKFYSYDEELIDVKKTYDLIENIEFSKIVLK